jgi:hypothetical protein
VEELAMSMLISTLWPLLSGAAIEFVFYIRDAGVYFCLKELSYDFGLVANMHLRCSVFRALSVDYQGTMFLTGNVMSQ